MSSILWVKKDGVKVRVGGGSAPAPPPPPSGAAWPVSAAEISAWQTRSVSGPYKTQGDAGHGGSFSPGGWDRIVAEKNTFMSSRALWAGPSDGTPFTATASTINDPPTETKRTGNRMASACVFWLVSGDTAVRDQIVSHIAAQLNHSTYPRLDFANTTVFPRPHGGDQNPMFEIATWMASYIWVLSIIGLDPFTSTQRTRIQHITYWLAEHQSRELSNSFGGLWPNRLSNSWPSTATSISSARPYLGGPLSSTQMRRPGNRWLSMARYFLMFAIWAEQIGYTVPSGALSLAAMKANAKATVKEYLIFGVNPPSTDPAGVASYTADFHRSTTSSPDAGLAYAAGLLASVITIADQFGRLGDLELFNYSTRAGTDAISGNPGSKCVTGDPDKTILYAMLTVSRYFNRAYDKRNEQDTGRIDGRNGPLVRDIEALVRGNLHYQNTEVAETYKRVRTGTAAYPSSPLPTGGLASPWSVDSNVFPDGMFLWGGLEGSVNPYGGA